MTTLDTPSPERNAKFEAWVALLPAKSWAKYDLSACRLGWDAALSSIPEQGVGVKLVPVEKLTPEMRAAAETAARKINPGRSEDHIKSVALDGLSIYRAIVAAAPSQPAAVEVTDEMVERVSVPYDGFTGDVIGSYTTREGKHGVVVQQDGTRVVHVYGRSRVEAALRSTP